ncbi:hypothetical protein C5167_041026 [Papaver somniferum]|uniref:Bidirectional sugar transporter SWEET n=1 Tax=Papaver somniferum TaxID=3469 RepID=A0A4Y7IGM5_PAPSO|nr:bidirectional sugar transporter SWEET5-like [Papaver somniferum]RZC48063.1 hypothetical protein C5167_041026 [Papaver somniferum]
MISAAAARRIVGIVGNVISFFLFLSPLPTFFSIYKKGAVEDFSPYPYIVTVLNCALWVFYGFVTPNSLLVITINGGGLVIELIYVAIYFFYADNKQRKRPCIWSLAEIVFLVAVVLLCSLIPNPQSWRGVVIGWLCVAVNIGMYAIPCLAMRQVYKTKSLEYMPFWLSLACFLNGLCWLAYSLLGFDKYILTSNGIGLVLGLIQIIVIGYYFFKYPQPKDYISWPNLPNWWKFLKSKMNNKTVDEKAGGGGKVELTDMV